MGNYTTVGSTCARLCTACCNELCVLSALSIECHECQALISKALNCLVRSTTGSTRAVHMLCAMSYCMLSLLFNATQPHTHVAIMCCVLLRLCLGIHAVWRERVA